MILTDDPMKLIVTFSHRRNKIMNVEKIADISTLTTSLYCLHSWLHYNPGWKRRFYKQSHSVPVSGCLVNVKVNLVKNKNYLLKQFFQLTSSSTLFPAWNSISFVRWETVNIINYLNERFDIIQDNYRNFTDIDRPEYLNRTGPVSCHYWRASLGKSWGIFRV